MSFTSFLRPMLLCKCRTPITGFSGGFVQCIEIENINTGGKDTGLQRRVSSGVLTHFDGEGHNCMTTGFSTSLPGSCNQAPCTRSEFVSPSINMSNKESLVLDSHVNIPETITQACHRQTEISLPWAHSVHQIPPSCTQPP